MASTIQKASSETRVILRTPADWLPWSNQFLIYAASLGLKDYVRGRSALLAFPQKPLLSDFPLREDLRPDVSPPDGSSGTVGGSSRGSSRGGNRGGSRAGTRNTPTTPQTIMDLSPEGREAYKMTMTEFFATEKRYNKQEAEVRALKTYMQQTVVQHYMEQATGSAGADEDDDAPDLSAWFQNLKQHVGVPAAEVQIDAQTAYDQAIKPISKPKEWETWLTNWEKAFARGRLEKRVLSTSRATVWVKDFLDAVRALHPPWAEAYWILKKDQIYSDQLEYRAMVNDFRQAVAAKKIPGGRVTKGAFASFADAGEDTPPGALGDAQSAEEGKPERRTTLAGKGPRTQGRSERRSSSKRRSPPPDRDSSQSCQACGHFHPLPKCFYVFPEKAPEGWEPNPAMKRMVEILLKSDSSLQEQVRKVKGKRTRFYSPPPRKD